MRLSVLGRGLLAGALGMAFCGAPASAGSPKNFIALLSSAQETPPIFSSSAHGNALLTLEDDTGMLCLRATFSGLGSPEILAHIHGPGAVGTAAGIKFSLPVGSVKSTCVGPLDTTTRGELMKGLLYINVHTVSFPGGEIRGQILRMK